MFLKLTVFEVVVFQVGQPILLTSAIYQECLQYTIQARLAPFWNKVGKYLVYGRNFLTSSAPLDAVKLEIIVNGNYFL